MRGLKGQGASARGTAWLGLRSTAQLGGTATAQRSCGSGPSPTFTMFSASVPGDYVLFGYCNVRDCSGMTCLFGNGRKRHSRLPQLRKAQGRAPLHHKTKLLRPQGRAEDSGDKARLTDTHLQAGGRGFHPLPGSGCCHHSVRQRSCMRDSCSVLISFCRGDVAA